MEIRIVYGIPVIVSSYYYLVSLKKKIYIFIIIIIIMAVGSLEVRSHDNRSKCVSTSQLDPTVSFSADSYF